MNRQNCWHRFPALVHDPGTEVLSARIIFPFDPNEFFSLVFVSWRHLVEKPASSPFRVPTGDTLA